MKDFIKSIYLFIFLIRYKLKQLFIKEKNDVVLFISEFPYTMGMLEERYKSDFIVLKFNPKNTKLKKQIKYMCKAKYIYIDNYNVLMPYIKKSKIKIQVWHAPIAIKKMGFSSNEIATKTEKSKKRYQKVYSSFDYYISPSQHMTDIFKKSLNIDEEKILPYGYLKYDYLRSSEYISKIDKIHNYVPELIDKLNIVYVPTFRDNELDNQEQIETIKKLENDFGENFNIWYKLHNNVGKLESKYGKKIEDGELEYILKYANIVITDYSSIFIDGLINKSQIIYYMYDYERYLGQRGLNVNIKDLPGIKIGTYDKLNEVITKFENTNNNISQLNEYYIPYNLKEEKSEVGTKILKKFHS